MVWDTKSQMIIDTAAGNETEDIAEEEHLVGFEFSAAVEATLERVTEKQFAPHDDDSVSTLRSADGTVKGIGNNRSVAQGGTSTITPHTENTTPVNTVIPQEDTQSEASGATTLTMESFNLLDSRITGLTSQLVAETNRNKQQFEAIMAALATLQTTQKNDQSSQYISGNTGADEKSSSEGS